MTFDPAFAHYDQWKTSPPRSFGDPRCSSCGQERDDHYEIVDIVNGEVVVKREPSLTKAVPCFDYKPRVWAPDY